MDETQRACIMQNTQGKKGLSGKDLELPKLHSSCCTQDIILQNSSNVMMPSLSPSTSSIIAVSDVSSTCSPNFNITSRTSSLVTLPSSSLSNTEKASLKSSSSIVQPSVCF